MSCCAFDVVEHMHVQRLKNAGGQWRNEYQGQMTFRGTACNDICPMCWTCIHAEDESVRLSERRQCSSDLTNDSCQIRCFQPSTCTSLHEDIVCDLSLLQPFRICNRQRMCIHDEELRQFFLDHVVVGQHGYKGECLSTSCQCHMLTSFLPPFFFSGASSLSRIPGKAMSKVCMKIRPN